MKLRLHDCVHHSESRGFISKGGSTSEERLPPPPPGSEDAAGSVWASAG